jgi:hypothetical protein
MGNSNKCKSDLERIELKYKKLSELYLMSNEKCTVKPTETKTQTAENDSLKQQVFELKYDKSTLINQDKYELINKYNSIIRKEKSFQDLIIDINTYNKLFSDKDYVFNFLNRLTQFSSVYLFGDPEIVTLNSELYEFSNKNPDELLNKIFMYIFSLDWGLVQ